MMDRMINYLFRDHLWAGIASCLLLVAAAGLAIGIPLSGGSTASGCNLKVTATSGSLTASAYITAENVGDGQCNSYHGEDGSTVTRSSIPAGETAQCTGKVPTGQFSGVTITVWSGQGGFNPIVSAALCSSLKGTS